MPVKGFSIPLLDKETNRLHFPGGEFLMDYIVSELQAKTNARLKIYPSQTVLQICSKAIFPTGNWEPVESPYETLTSSQQGDNQSQSEPSTHERKTPQSKKDSASTNPQAKQSAQARARRAVYDIALLNPWDWMFTWTLDPQKVDRYDPDEVYRYLKPALSNLHQRKGFVYLLVPEYHTLKPGEKRPGIHFHGLCRFDSVKLERATKRGKPRFDKHGKPVYNMTDWPYGWSTVVPLDEDCQKVAAYIAKYITKQPDKILGKYYLSSRDLVKEPKIIPLLQGVDYLAFRNDDKLMSGVQQEINLFSDVYLLSETIKRK